MINIQNVIVTKKYVSVNYRNPDIVTIPGSNLTKLVPDLKKFLDNSQQLDLEISTEYPFKIITPTAEDSSSIILSPSLTTFPTASQSYYVPLYAERFIKDFSLALTREFTELVVNSPSSAVV